MNTTEDGITWIASEQLWRSPPAFMLYARSACRRYEVPKLFYWDHIRQLLKEKKLQGFLEAHLLDSIKKLKAATNEST